MRTVFVVPPMIFVSSAPSPALLGPHLSPVAGQRRRWPRTEPVVAGAVERDHRALEGAAERGGGERDEPGVLLLSAEALQRNGAGHAPPDRLGVLAQRLGVEVAAASARTEMRSAAHSRATARVKPSTAARAALECVMPVRP